jgi:hypothetical protein
VGVALHAAAAATRHDPLRTRKCAPERFLLYAAGAGIDVDAGCGTISPRPGFQPWQSTDQGSGQVGSVDRRAAAVRPVTAASLRACDDKKEVDRTVRLYRRVGLTLALIIVLISLINS